MITQLWWFFARQTVRSMYHHRVPCYYLYNIVSPWYICMLEGNNYDILEQEIRFTLGLNAAGSTNYIETSPNKNCLKLNFLQKTHGGGRNIFILPRSGARKHQRFPIILKNASIKSRQKLNFLQKTDWVHMSTPSPVVELCDSKDLPFFKYSALE